MTVQSLYHYFDSRDALLSALVIDAHHALADAAQAAADGHSGAAAPSAQAGDVPGRSGSWALANRPAFLLLYGTPVPGFDPAARTESGQRGAGGSRQPFAEVVFDGWTPAQLAAVPLPDGGEALAAAVARKVGAARGRARRCSSSCARACTAS